MNNFHDYRSAEELFKPGHGRTLDELRALAARPARQCVNCDELEWKYGSRCGLCFSCTTGESDASKDFEVGDPPLISATPEPLPRPKKRRKKKRKNQAHPAPPPKE